MDLQKEWQKLQDKPWATGPLSELEIRQAIQFPSQAPLAGVVRVVRFRLYAVLGYLLLALAFMAFSQGYPEKFPIALLIFDYYLVALIFSLWQLWHLRQRRIDMGGDLRQTLRTYHRLVKSSIRIDAIAGWFIYPMSFALGFFYILIRPGRDTWDVLQTPSLLWPLVLGMAIVTPAFWWLNAWMNQRVFGNLVQQLEEKIREMEE
jgi:hypothetical protein